MRALPDGRPRGRRRPDERNLRAPRRPGRPRGRTGRHAGRPRRVRGGRRGVDGARRGARSGCAGGRPRRPVDAGHRRSAGPGRRCASTGGPVSRWSRTPASTTAARSATRSACLVPNAPASMIGTSLHGPGRAGAGSAPTACSGTMPSRYGIGAPASCSAPATTSAPGPSTTPGPRTASPSPARSRRCWPRPASTTGSTRARWPPG